MNLYNEAQLRVIVWNKERGLLDKGFDPKLELRMLSEEAREFYTAPDIYHMLAEYADFLFVRFGTFAKYYSEKIDSHTTFSLMRDEWIKIAEWIEDQEYAMASLLSQELQREFPDMDYESLVHLALMTVILNNESKGKKTVDGKVVKNEDHRDPADLIEAFIENMQANLD